MQEIGGDEIVKKLYYLVGILRGRLWRILKSYIPPTLFIETNLPAIRVEIWGDGRVEESDTEEAPLVLSMYIPGKPLFRVGSPRGAIIPIKRKRKVPRVCSVVNDYFDFEELAEDRRTIISALRANLPDELAYFLDKLGRSLEAVDIRLIDKVKPRPFYCVCESDKSDRRRPCYHWLSWFDGAMFSMLLDKGLMNYYMTKPKQSSSLRIVRKESNAYGRYCVLGITKAEDLLSYELKEKLQFLGFSHAELTIASNIVKALYAIDYRVKVSRLKIVDAFQLKGVTCIATEPDRLSTAGMKLIRGDIIAGVKIPCLGYDGFSSALIGYEIRSTVRLGLSLDDNRFLKKFAEEIFKDCRKACESLSRDRDLDGRGSIDINGLYAALTLNEILIDVIRFYLTSDLFIASEALNKRIDMDKFVDLAFSYIDLRDGDKISDIIRNSESCKDFVENFVSRLQSFVDKLKDEDPSILVLKHILFGTRVRTAIPKDRDRIDEFKRFLTNEVKDRLEKALCDKGGKDDWRLNVLRDVLRHTLSHHLMRVISETSRVRIDYLGEIYDVAPVKAKRAIEVFEAVSGGIGAIETAVNSWSSGGSDGDSKLVEDLVLRFGECLVGTPEDVVYLILLLKIFKGTHIDFSKFDNSLVNELNILITPEESNEIPKVYNALIEEAKRIASLASIDYGQLLSDVIRLRYECERATKRFCTVDEILVFALMNLRRFDALKTLLATLIQKYLETYKGAGGENVYEVLRMLLGTSNTAELARLILEELSDMSQSRTTRLYNAYKEKSDYRKWVATLITDIGRLFRASIVKLLLKSCEKACGFCYLNTHSCRFSAAWIQKNVLSRRLAKLYATWLITRRLGRRADLYLYEPEGLKALVGKVRIGGTEYFIYLGDTY